MKQQHEIRRHFFRKVKSDPEFFFFKQGGEGDTSSASAVPGQGKKTGKNGGQLWLAVISITDR